MSRATFVVLQTAKCAVGLHDSYPVDYDVMSYHEHSTMGTVRTIRAVHELHCWHCPYIYVDYE